MIQKRYALLCLPLLLFLIVIAVITVPLTNTDKAYAASWSATVSQTENGYSYTSDNVTDETEYNSLQALIEVLEAQNNEWNLTFNNVSSSGIITLTKSFVFNGAITFSSLQQDEYAITVEGEASLLLNANVTSNRGGIALLEESHFLMNTGYVTITNDEGETSATAIDVRGIAIFYGGIIFNHQSQGNGIRLRNSLSTPTDVTIAPENAFIVNADRALYARSGVLRVNGGTFRSDLSGKALVVNNIGNVTINGGAFYAPISYESINNAASLQINAVDVPDGAEPTLLLNQNYKGMVSIKNLTMTPTQKSKVKVLLSDLPNDNVSFVAIAGTATNQGYSIKKYVVGEVEYALNTPLLATETKNVSFTESNIFDLTLSVNGSLSTPEEHSYGDLVYVSDLPFNLPGYTLKTWRDNFGNTISSYVEITGDTVLYADIELSPCSISFPASTIFTYNGNDQTLTATVTHELPNAVLTYKWEKDAGNAYVAIEGMTSKSLTVHSVADSGLYILYVKVTDPENSNNRTTVSTPLSVTIQKGQYTGITHRELSGTYSPTKYCRDYELDEGFHWTLPDDVPVPSVHEYPAIYYIESERANYEDLACSIMLNVSKATPTAPDTLAYAGLVTTYSPTLTLANVVLPDFFRWADETIIPTVTNTEGYLAYYNPDTEYYNDLELYISVHVEKANYEAKDVIAPVLSMVYSDSFRTLDHLNAFFAAEFPDFRLQTTGNNELTMGTANYECFYNADSAHYNDFSISVVLTLNKATFVSVAPHGAVDVPYNHELHSATLNAFYYWKDGNTIAKNSGFFEAYYNSDPIHFENYSLEIYVCVIKADYKAEDVIIPVLEARVYDPLTKLKDIILPEGFSWNEPETTPIVAISFYSASFCDNEQYNPYPVEISLIITRAPLTMPIFDNFQTTYDGNEHAIYVTNIDSACSVQVTYKNNSRTNAGVTHATAYLTQADIDNYVLLPDSLQATITILKAPSVIEAPARIDVLVGETVRIEASVNNHEQLVIIPTISTQTEGLQTIILRVDESVNYLTCTRNVTVSVNAPQTFVGYITYPDNYDYNEYYGIVISESGVPVDAGIRLTPTEQKDGVIVSAENGFDESFTVKLLLPKEMRNAKEIVLMKDGEIVESYLENDVYLVFEAKDGDTFNFIVTEKDPFIWYWIPPVGVILIALVVIFILYKKKIIVFNHKKDKKTNEPL